MSQRLWRGLVFFETVSSIDMVAEGYVSICLPDENENQFNQNCIASLWVLGDLHGLHKQLSGGASPIAGADPPLAGTDD